MNPEFYIYKHPLKRIAAAAFDQLGNWIYPVFSGQPPVFNPDEVSRILAIRLDHMGDVLMARPALKLLADNFPHASLDFMVSEEFVPLLEQDSFIHRLIPVRHHWFQRTASALEMYQDFLNLAQEVKHEAYDLGIDFRGDLRNIALMTLGNISARLSYSLTGGEFLLTHRGDYCLDTHQAELNGKLLEKINIKGNLNKLPISYSEDKKKSFLSKFSFLKSDGFKKITIHMGAGYPTKRWNANYYRELIARLLKKQNTKVVLIGTKSERSDLPVAEYPGSLFDFRGLLALDELPILMDHSHFYIGNDSGPAHIAASQGTLGLVLFSGTNDSKKWRPYSESLEIIEKKVVCAPCESQHCPLTHHDCMELITPDEVFQKVQERLFMSHAVIS